MADQRPLCFCLDFSEHIDGTQPSVCDPTCSTSIQHSVFEKFPSAFEMLTLKRSLWMGCLFVQWRKRGVLHAKPICWIRWFFRRHRCQSAAEDLCMCVFKEGLCLYKNHQTIHINIYNSRRFKNVYETKCIHQPGWMRRCFTNLMTPQMLSLELKPAALVMMLQDHLR